VLRYRLVCHLVSYEVFCVGEVLYLFIIVNAVSLGWGREPRCGGSEVNPNVVRQWLESIHRADRASVGAFGASNRSVRHKYERTRCGD